MSRAVHSRLTGWRVTVGSMNNKKLLGAAAFTAVLAGGGLAGAMLGTPSLGSAQQGETTTTTAVDGSGDAGEAREEYGGRPHVIDLSVAAQVIGVTEDELRTALRDGQTIAEVAAAEGVDVQAVIDALTEDAIARIEAELPDRIAAIVNGEVPFERGDHGPRGGHVLPGLETAADALGITEDELRTALRDGQTIAEVATDQGVDLQSVIDALVAQANTRLDEAVANGRIDAARADEIRANLPDRITAFVNGEFREGRPGGPGPDGPGD